MQASKNYILLLIAFLFSTQVLFSQGKENKPDKIALGYSIGYLTGNGFSFRYHIKDRFAIQPKITFPRMNFSGTDGRFYELKHSGNLAFYYILKESKFANFDIYGTFGYRYKKIKYLDINTLYPTDNSNLEAYSKKYSGSIGFDFEVKIHPNFSINLMAGYGLYARYGYDSKPLSSSIAVGADILFYIK